MGKEKKVIIGGTFDILHDGHKALLGKANELGSISIGMTCDDMARKTKKRKISDFNKRYETLKSFSEKEFGANPDIFEINDKFGPTLERDFDYIVVSPATHKTALEINEKRQKKDKKPIEIVKIDFVLAKDGKPISSTRIFNGEIDNKGNPIKK